MFIHKIKEADQTMQTLADIALEMQREDNDMGMILAEELAKTSQLYHDTCNASAPEVKRATSTTSISFEFQCSQHSWSGCTLSC